MSSFKTVLGELRVAQMPWVIRVYILLFIILVLLLVYSASTSNALTQGGSTRGYRISS